ncbi:DNA polymerase III subunit gamma/tau [Pelomonas sp. APW6]|uniref:DNA polymerase III subunit gamma/tau n=1 Tax=Roseateles subflavus TaxID=3053353 RepID=A0ABT7LHF5_9BURK|nr:DNA polymerase III subunit gamma/tau [Pelomonas sp. APW6]MDL5032296.1 DNA polymerase III subunit gamma/tau [Pelomonas sp. APW6]
MSYQVLARKYRPHRFEELVGQEHVVQALANALTQQRLHHAYLFTGTRGVGKTTVSRILAKSLNCTGADGQGGITAQPCGVCPACRDIDAGRFVDYVELDAASNRGVEEISQLLDQAVYKPVVGRFKVYMIDEVHMLSNTAFNAMLKTLEEPPEYLKFVLATTDPQKVPVTVLSRCLQFNLRPMAPQNVQMHLGRVLEAEQVPVDTGSLRLLARAARGSMRDALSLTDQAIAFGSGSLSEDGVRQMLGTVDRSHVIAILDALIAADGPAVVAAADRLRDLGLSAGGTLEDLATALQQMAIAQAAPGALDPQDPDCAEAQRLAAALPADEIQLMYSMALHGRQELPLAPDEYAGLVMVLLRMLAFRPRGGAALNAGGAASAGIGAAPAATPAAAPLLRPATAAAMAVPARMPAAAPAAPIPAPAATSVAPPVAAPAQPSAVLTPPAAAPTVSDGPAQDLTPTPPADTSHVALAPADEPPEGLDDEPAAAEEAPVPPVDMAPPAVEEAPAPAPAQPPAQPAPSLLARTRPDDAVSPSARLRPRPVVHADAPEESGDEPPPWLDAPPADEDGAVMSADAGLDLPDPSPRGEGGYASTAGTAIALQGTALGERWAAVMKQLGLTALPRELGMQAECLAIDESVQPQQWRFRVERDSLRQPALKDKLQAALAAHLQADVRIELEAGVATDSPALREATEAQARQRRAEQIILEDPLVKELLAQFKTARIVPGSIKPH